MSTRNQPAPAPVPSVPRQCQVAAGIAVLAVFVASCVGSTRPIPAAPPASADGLARSATLTIEPLRAVKPATTDLTRTLAQLDELPFDDFLIKSYDALLVLSPENVTELGIAQHLGLGNDDLDDLSPAYHRDTAALVAAILDLLRGYDRDRLTPDQQLSYDIYAWILVDRVCLQRFAAYNFPLIHCCGGYHQRLVSLLTESQPMNSPKDAEDYLSRLGQVYDQVTHLLAGLQQSEQAGIVPPRLVVEHARGALADYLGTSSRDPDEVDVTALSVYTAFSTKLDGITDLSDSERSGLRSRAREAMRSSFVPAYMALLTHLDRLATVAGDEVGVWRLAEGRAYYARLLASQTTTDLTPDEVHELGLRQVSRTRAELREALTAMGYPAGTDLAAAISLAVKDAGVYRTQSRAGREEVVRAWQAIIDNLDRHLADAFGLRPKEQVAVVGGPDGPYYMPASTTHAHSGVFHVNLSVPDQPKYIMPTVAAHEVLGHHVQLSIQQELGLPPFRRDLRLEAYLHGWAVYTERLSWEFGLYDDDPYGNIGRLLAGLLRAARVVVDTGVHAKGWTRDEAIAYLAATAVISPASADLEVDRIVAAPAEATTHEIGMLQVTDLRERSEAALGDRFEMKAFHDALLGSGSMPLVLLRRAVDDYIAATLQHEP